MVTPRQKRRDATRQKILDTARAILVEKGLAGLSMRALAEQIDYSPSAIYKYFESKEHILQAIRAEGWELSSVLTQRSVDPSLSPSERLIQAGLAYLQFAEQYPEHYRLMFDTSDLPMSVQEIGMDPHFFGLAQMIEEGVQCGAFRLQEGYTPLSMAFQLWITFHGIAMLRLTLLKNYRAEFDPLIEQIMSAAIKNITVSGAKK